MGVQDEVVSTYRMVKNAGFEILDVIFEGAMTVQGKEVLSQLDGLAAKKRAMGVVRVVYSAGENKTRTIEIPVGEVLPELEGSP